MGGQISEGLPYRRRAAATLSRFSKPLVLRERAAVRDQANARPTSAALVVHEHSADRTRTNYRQITHNWRKVGEGENYPRYETLRERFFSELEELDLFFKSWQICTIRPNQCEITYVNRLELKGHELRAQPGRAVSLLPRGDLQPEREGAKLPEAEDCNLTGRYVLKDADGQARGRLLITVRPWPNEPVLRLDLTLRGAPRTADFKAVADFLT